MNTQNKKSFREFDLAFIDTETTGLGINNELIEMAVVRVEPNNFKILEEWEIKIKPQHLELADPEALKLNHYNEDDWQKAADLETALKIFLEKTSNTILVGDNLSFDWFFIHKALAECNLQSTFDYRKLVSSYYYKGLDIFSLAWQKLRKSSEFQRLSLSELANRFNIKQEKAHSALDDARTTYKIFLKLLDL